MAPRRLRLKLRRWTRSVRWSIGHGLSDLWTLRRWLTSVRLALAVVGLVVAAATFGTGLVGSDSYDGPQQYAVPEAQWEALCRKAALDSERIAREYEAETGEPGQGFSKESCLRNAAEESGEAP